MNHAQELDYAVIIVGAGPTGVVAANLLGSYGVSTLVFDREADIVTIPRAVGMCEEGSRILDNAGVMQLHAPHCHTINNVFFVDRHLQPQFHADVDWRKNGYRPIRMFHQPDLERDLRSALMRFDHVEQWLSTEMVRFEDRGDRVQVTVRRNGEEQSLSCRYLFACDGASSPVRKSLGIGFSGSTYPQDWVILDIENNPLPDNNVAFSIDPRRPSVTMPGPNGRRRWEFVVKRDDDVDSILEETSLRGLIAPWGDMSGVRIARKAVYTFHARTSANYRKGNVFLLGDAAHVTPPFAGQGMMAGLRDAYNLCWKVAVVLQGRAGSQLLASYEHERIPQSKQIISFAQIIGNIVLPQEKLKARVRDALFRILGLLGIHSATVGVPLRKLPNHINGSLPRHILVHKLFKTGVELPQFQLDTCCGMRAAADKLMGNHFQVIGWNRDPHDSLSSHTLHRWGQAGGKVTTLTSGENFDTRADLLLDRRQSYRDTFDSGRRILVLRPDNMLVLRCKPAALDQKLQRYMDSIGCQPQRRTNSSVGSVAPGVHTQISLGDIEPGISTGMSQ